MFEEHEQRFIGYTVFYSLIDELRLRQNKSPEIYNEIADLVTRQRERLGKVYSINDFPPVPKQNEIDGVGI
jgi:hypothetical protein